MDKARITRRLRIACTTVCLILCGALCALWARSFTVHDTAYCQTSPVREFYVNSLFGRILIGSSRANTLPQPFDVFSASLEPIDRVSLNRDSGRFGLNLVTDQSGWRVFLPYWFLVCLVIALAAVPWIRWRFSLRTLLIATTLVAVALGVAVAMRQ